MKSNFTLKIKEPCQENYNQFLKTKKGGFCNSCSKEVIDFSKMNSEEIVKFFSQKRENTCGRFSQHQLKKYETHKQRKSYSLLTALGLLFLSFFTFGKVQAQEKIKTGEIKQDEKDFKIEGVVKDETGTLPGVSVLLKNTTIGAETDFDGKFIFPKKLKKGDVLVFNYLGYKTQKVIIDGKNNKQTIELKIDLDELENVVLMGAVDVKKVFKSKKKNK